MLQGLRCIWPGCGQHHHLQIDHADPHSAGGATNQDNADLACGHHNRFKHHGYTTRRAPNGTWHTYRPDGTENHRRLNAARLWRWQSLPLATRAAEVVGAGWVSRSSATPTTKTTSTSRGLRRLGSTGRLVAPARQRALMVDEAADDHRAAAADQPMPADSAGSWAIGSR